MAWSWYTKGRRIPTLIGKDVSGRRIPGGPYTGLQAVTAAAVPAVLWWTRGLWAAELAGLAMFAVLVGVTVAAVKMVGKVDFASRNPMLLLGGYLRQTGRPMNGTLAGRKLAEPRPHRPAGRIEVTYSNLDTLADTARDADELRSAAPARSIQPSLPPAEAAVPAVDVAPPASPAAAPTPASTRPPASRPRTYTGKSPLQPASPPAPDRRRSGLEAFLAGAAVVRARDTEEEAA